MHYKTFYANMKKILLYALIFLNCTTIFSNCHLQKYLGLSFLSDLIKLTFVIEGHYKTFCEYEEKKNFMLLILSNCTKKFSETLSVAKLPWYEFFERFVQTFLCHEI